MIWFLFFSVSIIWGGAYLAIKDVVGVMPPQWAVLYRLIFAFLAAIVLEWVWPQKLEKVSFSTKLKLWRAGLFTQAVPFALLFWGEQHVSAGLAGIFQGLVPLWTFVFGFLIFPGQEPFRKRSVFALSLGIAGMTCIFAPKWISSQESSSLWGALAVLGMSICYGIGGLLIRDVHVKNPKLTKAQSLLHQSFSSILLIAPLAFCINGPPDPRWLWQMSVLKPILYLAVLSTAFGLIVHIQLIQRWGALRASSTSYSVPIATLILDFLLNKQIPNPTDLAGAIFILISLTLFNY